MDEIADDGLDACLTAWNAEQRRLCGEPASTARTIGERLRAQVYYAANKERIAQRVRDRKARRSLERMQAMAVLSGPPTDDLGRSVAAWNAEQQRLCSEKEQALAAKRETPAYKAAAAYRERNREAIAAKARQRRAWARLLG